MGVFGALWRLAAFLAMTRAITPAMVGTRASLRVLRAGVSVDLVVNAAVVLIEPLGFDTRFATALMITSLLLPFVLFALECGLLASIARAVGLQEQSRRCTLATRIAAVLAGTTACLWLAMWPVSSAGPGMHETLEVVLLWLMTAALIGLPACFLAMIAMAAESLSRLKHLYASVDPLQQTPRP